MKTQLTRAQVASGGTTSTSTSSAAPMTEKLTADWLALHRRVEVLESFIEAIEDTLKAERTHSDQALDVIELCGDAKPESAREPARCANCRYPVPLAFEDSDDCLVCGKNHIKSLKESEALHRASL